MHALDFFTGKYQVQKWLEGQRSLSVDLACDEGSLERESVGDIFIVALNFTARSAFARDDWKGRRTAHIPARRTDVRTVHIRTVAQHVLVDIPTNGRVQARTPYLPEVDGRQVSCARLKILVLLVLSDTELLVFCAGVDNDALC